MCYFHIYCQCFPFILIWKQTMRFLKYYHASQKDKDRSSELHKKNFYSILLKMIASSPSKKKKVWFNNCKCCLKYCTYLEARQDGHVLADALSNKSWLAIFPEFSTPGGTFTFHKSTTAAISMELPDLSVAQLLRQSVLSLSLFFFFPFLFWGECGCERTCACLYTVSLCEHAYIIIAWHKSHGLRS